MSDDRRDPVDEAYRPAYHKIRDDTNLTQAERTAAISALNAEWQEASAKEVAEAEKRAPEIVAKALAAVRSAAGGSEYEAYSGAFDRVRADRDLTRAEHRVALALLNEQHRGEGVIPKSEQTAPAAPANETLDQMRERVFAMPKGR